MIVLVCIILIIGIFDFRAMMKNKQQRDMICFIAIAVGSILYGYYYNTHMYTASVIGFLLRLLNVK